MSETETEDNETKVNWLTPANALFYSNLFGLMVIGLNDSEYVMIQEPWLIRIVALVMIFNFIVLLVFAGGDK